MSIAYDGRPCPCGNAGCIERYASTVAVVEAARADVGLAQRLGATALAVRASIASRHAQALLH